MDFNGIAFKMLKYATVENARRLRDTYFDVEGMQEGKDYLITDMNYNPVTKLEKRIRPVVIWVAEED
jgi:hypothetical protein